MVSEDVILLMVLLWLNSGLGDLNKTKLENLKLQLILITCVNNKRIIEGLVSSRSVAEVPMEPSFIIILQRLTAQSSQKTWSIWLIQEDNTWMEQLMWQGPSILVLRLHKKKTHSQGYFWAIWTSKRPNGQRILKWQEAISMSSQGDPSGKKDSTSNTVPDTELGISEEFMKDPLVSISTIMWFLSPIWLSPMNQDIMRKENTESESKIFWLFRNYKMDSMDSKILLCVHMIRTW